jgi:hypothetical protein
VQELRARGVTAPIYVNINSESCGQPLADPGQEAQRLQFRAMQLDLGQGGYAGLRPGIDLDQANPSLYLSGCHLSSAGLDWAAAQWATLLGSTTLDTLPCVDSPPSCTLATLPARFAPGALSSITFVLSSVGGDHAILQGGTPPLLMVPASFAGATGIVPTQTTTFSATVTGAGGSVTCTTTTFVCPGGC